MGLSSSTDFPIPSPSAIYLISQSSLLSVWDLSFPIWSSKMQFYNHGFFGFFFSFHKLRLPAGVQSLPECEPATLEPEKDP